MRTSSNYIGHIACFGAYFIFGFNIVMCKDISSAGVITPMELFFLRSLGATILFWLTSLFMPHEKVCSKDLVLIFLASMLGLFVTQIAFLKAITITTSIDASLLSSATPIFTMFVAAIFLKEPITLKKAGGVLLSFMGVLMLIFNSSSSGGAEHTSPLGIVLMLTNGLAFALYLGIFRPLIAKYSAVTFMKWMFLFSMIVSAPLVGPKMLEIRPSTIDAEILWQIAYVVVFATFISYFLIPIGQKHLRPTIVSMYSYVQPIIATLISIVIGIDHLSWQKIIAATLIFSGVAIVNRSRAAHANNHPDKKS